MKLMIASDIHGCAPACRRLLDIFEASGAQRLILLGDLLYHGPRNDLPAGYDPKAVIAMLTPYADRLFCVRGNCDTEVDQMVLTFPILADYAVLFDGERELFATHGHHVSPQNPPHLAEGSIRLGGHTERRTQQKQHTDENRRRRAIALLVHPSLTPRPPGSLPYP